MANVGLLCDTKDNAVLDRQSEWSNSNASVTSDRFAALRSAPTIEPMAIPVRGISRDIVVKIASTEDEWEQAFGLVSDRYKDRGYVETHAESIHFTPYHALPDTVTFVAKERDTVVATVSLVPDNTILGLPMDHIYGHEINELRRTSHRLNEITCLASADLSTREFIPTFMQLCRLMFRYTVSQGSNEWVIEINPRHVGFHKKTWGFVPIGPRRACPSVQGAPAEAFFLDVDLMQQNAPRSHDLVFGSPIPEAALVPCSVPLNLALCFAIRSSEAVLDAMNDFLSYLGESGPVRRW